MRYALRRRKRRKRRATETATATVNSCKKLAPVAKNYQKLPQVAKSCHHKQNTKCHLIQICQQMNHLPAHPTLWVVSDGFVVPLGMGSLSVSPLEMASRALHRIVSLFLGIAAFLLLMSDI